MDRRAIIFLKPFSCISLRWLKSMLTMGNTWRCNIIYLIAIDQIASIKTRRAATVKSTKWSHSTYLSRRMNNELAYLLRFDPHTRSLRLSDSFLARGEIFRIFLQSGRVREHKLPSAVIFITRRISRMVIVTFILSTRTIDGARNFYPRWPHTRDKDRR